MKAKNLFEIKEGIDPDWSYLRQPETFTLFQTPAWIETWTNYYGSGWQPIHLLTKTGSGEWAGFFPLMRGQQFGVSVLQFLSQSGGFSCDYPGAIMRPGGERSALDALFAWLDEDPNWDVLDLEFPGWNTFLSDFTRALVLRAPKWHSHTSVKSFCSRIRLPDNYDDYLESLGSTTRRDVRKYSRAFSNVGGVFRVWSGSEILDHLPELYRLNGLNWRVFDTTAAKNLWRDVVMRGTGEGLELLMPMLEINDVAVATVLCIRVGDHLYMHPAGVDRSERRFSPGLVLYTSLIEHAISSGLTTLDLSPGLEEYKLRIGGTIYPKYKVRVSRDPAQLNRYINRSEIMLRIKRNRVFQRAYSLYRSWRGR